MIEAVQGAPRRMVVFRIAEQRYALPLEVVQEIVSVPLLSRPAGMPSILAGYFSLGSDVVAVLRVDRLLGSADRPQSLYTPLIVLRSSTARLALMVDEVVDANSIPEGTIVSFHETNSFNGCTEALAVVNGHHVAILSPDRLLLKAEKQRLVEFTAREKCRLAELLEATP